MKRQELIERRRLAQLRRARAEISGSFRQVARRLCTAGIRCSKLMPVHIARLLGDKASGPGEDEELDLSWIPGAQLAAWSHPAQRDDLCGRAIRAVAREDESVALVWHPARAGLRMRAADLREQVSILLDEGHGDTTWLVSASGADWLIQIAFWSSTISYARHVPSRREGG
jgi:hypothetical protein